MHTVIILVTSTVHGHTVVNVWTVVLFIHRSVDEANMRWCNRVWMSLARLNNPGVGGNTFGHRTKQHVWFVFQVVCMSLVHICGNIRSIAGRNKTLTRLDSVYVNCTNLHVRICHPKHRSCHPTQNPAGINYQTLHFCEPIKMIKLLHAMAMVMYIQCPLVLH